VVVAGVAAVVPKPCANCDGTCAVCLGVVPPGGKGLGDAAASPPATIGASASASAAATVPVEAAAPKAASKASPKAAPPAASARSPPGPTPSTGARETSGDADLAALLSRAVTIAATPATTMNSHPNGGRAGDGNGAGVGVGSAAIGDDANLDELLDSATEAAIAAAATAGLIEATPGTQADEDVHVTVLPTTQHVVKRRHSSGRAAVAL